MSDGSNIVKVKKFEKLFHIQKKVKLTSNRNSLLSVSKNLASIMRYTGPRLYKSNCEEIGGSNNTESDFALKLLNVFYNLTPSELYENSLKDDKFSHLTSEGALATLSGVKTGRSPKDKHIICDDDIWWSDKGSPNIRIDDNTFKINRERACDYLASLNSIYVFDGFLGWDPKHQLKIRIICARAYHALFMHNMLIRPKKDDLENFGDPDFLLLNAGQFPSNRFTSLNSSSISIDINFKRNEIIILGTQYAGEMKKALFSVMHYLLPKKNVLSLHSSINESIKDKSTTIFFGLSGTGKTTLATDPFRRLIGDDEHGWSDDGVFNFEGGCYAKCINLSQHKEPDIYNAIKFGTILENIVFNENRKVNYKDVSITENTRACYPIDFIKNVKIPCIGKHPSNIILLTCDCFGVLPPVSRLTLDEVIFYFINGYTSKIPGTEQEITEPQITFSACFGEAFIIWHPLVYAKMLAEKVQKHGSTAWLINTGWQGGGYKKGNRIDLKYTRAIVDIIHNGGFPEESYKKLPIFNLEYPTECKGIPSKILDPLQSWENKEKYLSDLNKLGELFVNNFKKYGNETVKIYEKILPKLI